MATESRETLPTNPNEIRMSDSESGMEISFRLDSPKMAELEPEVREKIENLLSAIGYSLQSSIEEQEALKQGGYPLNKALELISSLLWDTHLFLEEKVKKGKSQMN